MSISSHCRSVISPSVKTWLLKVKGPPQKVASFLPPIISSSAAIRVICSRSIPVSEAICFNSSNDNPFSESDSSDREESAAFFRISPTSFLLYSFLFSLLVVFKHYTKYTHFKMNTSFEPILLHLFMKLLALFYAIMC